MIKISTAGVKNGCCYEKVKLALASVRARGARGDEQMIF
jgi:hypothetical protein